MNITELPTSVLIGSLEDISIKDAESYCRMLIEKFTGDPLNSYFLLKEVDGEIYYEIQEGGNGKGYLASVIEKMAQGPGDIIIPSVTRYLKVRVKEDGKIFQILPEKEKPPVTEGVIRQEKMIPYQKESKVVFTLGMIGTLIGMGILLTCYIVYANQVRETPIQVFNEPMKEFPNIVWQMDKITSLNPTSYVSKLEYKNSRWSIKKKEFDVVKKGTDKNKNSAINTDVMTKMNREGAK